MEEVDELRVKREGQVNLMPLDRPQLFLLDGRPLE